MQVGMEAKGDNRQRYEMLDCNLIREKCEKDYNEELHQGAIARAHVTLFGEASVTL